jgi:hypothetical protein
MALQGRKEGFNKGVIRGSTGSSKITQHMAGLDGSSSYRKRDV